MNISFPGDIHEIQAIKTCSEADAKAVRLERQQEGLLRAIGPKEAQIRAMREANVVARAVNNVTIVAIEDDVTNANARRQAKWRSANLELNRQRAKDGMRKRRAAEKNNG